MRLERAVGHGALALSGVLSADALGCMIAYSSTA